jgi:glycosyltransferase involved in cell wall biosynthesis
MDDNIGAFVTRHQSGELSRCGIRYYLGRLYLPLFDHHFANSQYTADELLDATVSGHERPVEVMPMGAEVREFLGVAPSESSRRALMASVGINATRPSVRTLLYVGRLSPEKNMGLLIDLMERLSSDAANEYHLLIAGDGPLLDHLGSEGQRRAPGRVHLLGHISDRSRIIELYHNSDIFVHPNPREPFGIAPLEAMAAGLPIVAPRSGGLLSYASDSNAWLCEPNAENYATAIRSITADPVRREERVALARATASRYRWSDVTARFEMRFEELCRGFSAARIGNQGEQIQ